MSLTSGSKDGLEGGAGMVAGKQLPPDISRFRAYAEMYSGSRSQAGRRGPQPKVARSFAAGASMAGALYRIQALLKGPERCT